MKKYISLLRGINVSGQKKIKMVDLKALYETLGFTDVLTYIQSGNVIFNSEIKDKFELIAKLEEAIQTRYGFYVPVQICTLNDLNDVLSNLPFKDINVDEDGARSTFHFCRKSPPQKKSPRCKHTSLNRRNSSLMIRPYTCTVRMGMVEPSFQIHLSRKNWV